MIELLEKMLADARKGLITEIYAVLRWSDGEYDDAYDCADIQLMLSEVQQLALRTRIRAAREKEPPGGGTH